MSPFMTGFLAGAPVFLTLGAVLYIIWLKNSPKSAMKYVDIAKEVDAKLDAHTEHVMREVQARLNSGE